MLSCLFPTHSTGSLRARSEQAACVPGTGTVAGCRAAVGGSGSGSSGSSS